MENRKDSFSDLFHLLNLKRLEKGFLETEVAREVKTKRQKVAIFPLRLTQ